MTNILKTIFKKFIKRNKLNLVEEDDDGRLGFILNLSFLRQEQNKCSNEELARYIFRTILKSDTIDFLESARTLEMNSGEYFVDIEITRIAGFNIKETLKTIPAISIFCGKIFEPGSDYYQDDGEVYINMPIDEFRKTIEIVKQEINKLPEEKIALYLLKGMNIEKELDSLIEFIDSKM